MIAIYFGLLVVISVFPFFNACPSGWFPSLLEKNKCYQISDQQLSWADAEDYCQNNGAPFSHLTSLLSAFDTNEISAILAASNFSIGQDDPVWIGARGINGDEHFEWIDGAQMDYTNWLLGQPNLLYSCVSSLARKNGKWLTESCETKNYFICKYFMQPTQLPNDCFDWHFANGNSTSGVYQIFPFGSSTTRVLDAYCDMTTDGGGWTVFQRRTDGTLMFYNRTWTEYKLGFNNGLENSFWLGNDNIHVLSTKDPTVDLRIDLWGDTWLNSSAPNGYWFDKYVFYLDNETNFYTLHIDLPFVGNASADQRSSIHYNDGMKFSTVDVDNDNWDGVVSCAIAFEAGGWWYDECTVVSLNGKYVPPEWHDEYGFTWYTPQSFFVNPRQSRMMLRKRIQ